MKNLFQSQVKHGDYISKCRIVGRRSYCIGNNLSNFGLSKLFFCPVRIYHQSKALVLYL